MLDSCVLVHLLRGCVPGRYDDVTRAVLSRHLLVGLDRDLALLQEWRTTAGAEAVQALFIRWSDAGGVRVVDGARIPSSVSKQLRTSGFEDTVDKLIVRIALAIKDKWVVTEDSDFWDPRDKRALGNAAAPVAKVLLALGLRLFPLSGAIAAIGLPSVRAQRKAPRKQPRRADGSGRR